MTLKEILKEKDLTYAWLSRRCGVDPVSVSKWAKGENKPGIVHVRRMAEALGMTDTEVIDCFIEKKAD